MSEETIVARLARRDWLVDGLLASVVDPYIDHLFARRYARSTIGSYLRCVAHFAYWMQAEHLALSDVGPELVKRFVGPHLNACSCPAPRKRVVTDTRAALRCLLRLLAERSRLPAKVPTPFAAELERFRHYLVHTRGLTENTCYYRLKHVGDFLIRCSQSELAPVASLDAVDVERFVLGYIGRWSPRSLSVLCGDLASYLRFRAVLGDRTQALIAALPRFAKWKHTTLPKALSDSELAAFLAAFDQSHPTGMRDFAVARCMVDLGLRGHEVAALRLESLDWHCGTLMIDHSKGKRVHRLPLPPKTGAAIARYLRRGRPQTNNRALFVRHVAPYDKPLVVPAIRSAMNRGFERCGLADRFCNTHVLRHTTAVRLQRSGASVKEIADVLRHCSIESTTTYARVDVDRLRGVALPWPGRRA